MVNIESVQEFEFFWKLASLKDALTLSVTDPVVMTDYTAVGKTGMLELPMFYDCWDNESEAMEVMNQRIRASKNDLSRHLALHKKMVRSFSDINDYMRRNNRIDLLKSYSIISDVVLENAELVESHHLRMGEQAYLNYPSADTTRFFLGMLRQSDDGAIMRHLAFNETKDMQGIVEELEYMSSLCSPFLYGPTAVPVVSLGDDESEVGISGTSYISRFALTLELLRRAGYEE